MAKLPEKQKIEILELLKREFPNGLEGVSHYHIVKFLQSEGKISPKTKRISLKQPKAKPIRSKEYCSPPNKHSFGTLEICRFCGVKKNERVGLRGLGKRRRIL